MRTSSLPLLFLSLVAACGDIEIQSVRTGLAIPLAMEGEWTGAWSSANGSNTGSLNLRLQSYAGQAVVAVTINNPCVVPRTYQIFVTSTTIELHADGEVVLAAVLGDDRTMAGTYRCDQDEGLWQAVWQRDLPPVRDLSGLWEGTVSAAGTGSGTVPLQLILHQSVRGGVVVVDGSLALPGLLGVPLGVTGSVRFRDGAFDFLLGTTSGVVPSVQLAGLGDAEELVIDDGLLLAPPSPLLPFQNAVWQVTWKSR